MSEHDTSPTEPVAPLPPAPAPATDLVPAPAATGAVGLPPAAEGAPSAPAARPVGAPAGATGRAAGRRGGRGRYAPRRRVCQFCADHIEKIDYKDVNRLRRYLSDRAKIEPRRKTGTCARHQRELSLALKRARFMALLPYTAEHIRFSGIVLRG